jgi:mono/diheme cytochrome c family protein
MRAVILVLLAPFVAGCDDQSMVQQKRYAMYSPAQLWANGSEAQSLPVGVVSHNAVGDEIMGSPPPLTAAMMQNGETKFDTFCSPCHGRSGDGRGIVVQHGFPAPQPLDAANLRAASAERLFNAISNGLGKMYPFAARIAPGDRWAIVAYIRALQLSQESRVADLPNAADKLP